MHAFGDLPLQRRLVLVMMLTSCAALLFASAAFVTNDIVNLRRSIGEDLTTLTRIIGASSTAAVTFGDRVSAEETLETLENQPHILAAAIYFRDGELLAEYFRAELGEASLPPPMSEDSLMFWDNYVDIYRGIYLDGERIGTIFMRSDVQKLNSRLLWYLLVVAVVLAFSLLLAFLVSKGFQRLITDPIVRLAGTARRISVEKNYALRASAEGQDEIRDLIDGFNEMLDEIQRRDVELKRHRERLEEMVARRTAELQQANLELAEAKDRAESAARRLAHQAYHDALTGLPNRVLLNDRLSVALAHAERNQSLLALLFLDVDQFKLINDTLGHASGDTLLCMIAERLQECVRSEDTIARLGGDEFMILLPYIQHAEDAAEVAHKITEALNRPLVVEGQELHLTISIGISIYPDDGGDVETLMRNADASMYRAKESGRNQYMFYRPDMAVASYRRLALESQLRRVVERDELRLFFQPQVMASDSGIIGAEALLRWENPDMGMLGPDQFIPLAEEIGVIEAIGEWVMLTACQHAQRWQAAGYEGFRVSVNLSARQFQRDYMQTMVQAVLDETGLPSGSLELEITESLSMQNVHATIETLNALHAMGVQIAIDDFGTGYSSLSYLKKFPIHTVKIDRSFVQDIPEDRDDAALASAIIAMAHSLGLRVVAEGVETDDQLRFFRAQACDLLQGYLFGRPVPASEFAQLLAERWYTNTVASGE